MAKLGNFAIDLELAKNGVTVDMGDGLKVTVARAGTGNDKYEKTLTQLLKPHERQVNKGKLSNDVWKKVIDQAYAEAVILGWSGLEDEDGNEIPYSKEKCLELLSDPQFSEFKDMITGLANEVEVFRKLAKEDTKS